MDELLRDFLTETGENLDRVDAQLVRFEQEPNNGEILRQIFRLVHTIKGTCGFLGLVRLQALTHAAESLIGKFRDGAPVTSEAVTLILLSVDRIKAILGALAMQECEPEGSDSDLIERLVALTSGTATPAPAPVAASRAERSSASAGEIPVEPVERPQDAAEALASHSIRVGLDTLDQLMTTVSELVLTRNQLLEISRRHQDSEFVAPLQRLSNVTSELQDGVMKTRMQPIGHAWQKLPRLLRDLAVELGKDIELQTEGADTELDRQVLELVKDPLIHLVRNCADHGIETPAERIAAGKPAAGKIMLRAHHQGGHVIIEVADDGRGLDLARIKARAMDLGLAGEAELAARSDGEICELIFEPGFSTAAAVTSVSGRGIGMDVVRNNIEQIGGSVDLNSLAGQGTRFTIKIPLTLAIVSALIVQSGEERFAIPQLSVLEVVRIGANGDNRIERIAETQVLRLRDKLLALVPLRRMLRLGDTTTDEGCFVVVMQVGNQTFGLVVEGVLHTEEIVIKPVSSKLRHLAVYSGTTILGDGSVIMILDPNGVAQTLGRVAQSIQGQASAGETTEALDQANTVPFLVFRAGSQRPKAVPLALVTRIEELPVDRIEEGEGGYVVQYREQLMPVLRIEGDGALKPSGAQPILVFGEGKRCFGLLIDEIVDIVEDRLEIELPSDRDGFLGQAIIKGTATTIIDVGHFLPRIYENWSGEAAPVAAGRRQSVLLVDDSPFFRELLSPLIKAAGYRVVTAASARQALDVLKVAAGGDRSFTLVVADADMPGMDGFALAEAMRADPRTAAIPVIGLAAMATAETVERGRIAGFHDFVAKFDRAGLIAAIKEQSAEFGRAA